MKTAILAGGLGTRLAEETGRVPKPMVPIGNHPMLWHVMNLYSAYGFNDFAVALGYKADVVKEYFLNFRALSSDLHIDLASGEASEYSTVAPDWQIDLIDTGLDTMTGGRLRRLRPWIGNETFMLTYGDGLSDVNIRALVDFHRSHGRLATVTAVRPAARFGSLVMDGDAVRSFEEKPQTHEGWINGGFFVLEPGVLDYVDGDATIWEREPMEQLARDGQLMAFRHDGFWQAMDTLREKMELERLWETGNPPWRNGDPR